MYIHILPYVCRYITTCTDVHITTQNTLIKYTDVLRQIYMYYYTKHSFVRGNMCTYVHISLYIYTHTLLYIYIYRLPHIEKAQKQREHSQIPKKKKLGGRNATSASFCVVIYVHQKRENLGGRNATWLFCFFCFRPDLFFFFSTTLNKKKKKPGRQECPVASAPSCLVLSC